MADKRAQSDRQSYGESTAKRIRPSDTQRICPHCAKSISERTYYRLWLYYLSSTKTWQTEARKDREEDPKMWSADEFDLEPITAGSPNEVISEDAFMVSIAIRKEFGPGHSGHSACVISVPTHCVVGLLQQ